MAIANELGDLQEVKSQWIQWGRAGDWCRGTLTDVREVENQLSDKAGEMQKVYEFIAQSGSFHRIVDSKVEEKATLLKDGDFWTVGGKAGIDNAMRNVKVGQIFGMRFAEEKPSKTKGFHATKIIKVLVGSMDENYRGEAAADIEE